MNAILIAMITYYANVYGVDPKVAVAVAQVESSLNPNAMGKAGEVGLFQLMPSNYPKINKSKLFDVETNIKYGVSHLAWNKKYCKHQGQLEFLVCFNYGIKNAEHVRYPKLFPYYKKVVAKMNEFKKGEKVMVKGLYGMEVDGEVTYIGPSTEHHYKGYSKVLNEDGLVMNIEPNRLTHYDKYWSKK